MKTEPLKYLPSGRWQSVKARSDIFGRVYILNIARPVTLWRRARAFAGWHERDSLLGNMGAKNKAKP